MEVDNEDDVNSDRDSPITLSGNQSESSQIDKKYVEEDDDGSLCPICLDNWTNSGEQRICALKCGHVFCHRCVVRWLDSQHQKSCPTCKKKATKSDIRFLYTKKLIAIDNCELETLRHQLEVCIQEKHKLQLELSKFICREGIYKQNIAELQSKINLLNSEVNRRAGSDSTDINNVVTKLYMEKSLEICKERGCRVFDSDANRDLIVVSAKSPNNLFAGFGVRKVQLSIFKPYTFIPLHQSQIRDVAFHSVNNWLLSVSMDKSFKVTDLQDNKVISSSSQNMPLWSCCWDSDDNNCLYIGTQAGTLVKYDVRNLNEPTDTLSIIGDMSPVVSIASLPRYPGDFPNGGVIICKLNSLWLFERFANDYNKHSLILNGPFVSMKYNKDNNQLLVSTRPNNLITQSRHIISTIHKNPEDVVSCNVIHTFLGGGMQKLLSKSCFVSNKEDYVAAFEESNKCVYLWSINSGRKSCSIPAHEAVLDLKGIKNISSDNFLISLTERKMEFFKFV